MKKKLFYKMTAICMLAVFAAISITGCTTNSYGAETTTEATTTAAEATTEGTTEATETTEATATTAQQAEDLLSSGETEATVEKKTFPYVKAFLKDSKESSINLYYVDGGDIPYVALSEYMPFYCEVRKDMKVDDISYDVSELSDHFYMVKRTDRDAVIMLDTEEDVLYLPNFNLFTQPKDVSALVSIMNIPDPKEPDLTNLIEKIENAKTEEERNAITEELEKQTAMKPDSLFSTESNSINRAGDNVRLNLSDYLIDFVEHDGECYVPLQTMNDLFMGQFYLQFVFNGKKLYGFTYGSEPIEEMYAEEPKEMSQEFANFNFNELCFFLDCFYGLKEEHNISNFGQLILANPAISEGLTSTNPDTFDTTLGIFISQFLDDGHSAYREPSWMVGPLDEYQNLGVLNYAGIFLQNSTKLHKRLATARQEAYPDGVPMYEEIGDTAFVTFDAFLKNPYEDLSYYYNSKNAPDPKDFVIYEEEDDFLFSDDTDDAEEETTTEAATKEETTTEADASEDAESEDSGEYDPSKDTIWLLIYANQMIHRENSPIKNVVVDLSQNGGGESDAALFVISWLTGQARVALKDTFTSAETIMTIDADVNLDNSYETTKDSLGDDINAYVLTSPVSFSCGNLVPAACKMAHNVTLVGQTSGGGSCSVLACTTASGTLFQLSSSQQLSTVKNGAYYNIDQGVEPDIILTKLSSFYDRKALAEYLKERK